MKRRFILACVLLLFPSVVMAAYQNPTVIDRQPMPSGFVKVMFQFTGNAGEATREREFILRPGVTAANVRNWVDDTKKELDLLHTAVVLPALQPGQTVTALARVAATTTAKEVWNGKYDRYKHFKDAGLLGATYASDLAAMKSDIEATYQTGFLNP